MLRAPERGIHGVWTRSVARLRRAARALAARAPRRAWRAAAAALVSLNRSGRRAEAMRAAGSSDRRTCSIDRAATSAGRACAAVAGVAASSGRRRTQAAIASMWNAARRAHGSLLDVPARRNRALALPGVLPAASAVLGACYSARIWHDGVFRLSENSALGTGSLPLRESGAYRSVFVVSSAALQPKETAQALLPARYSRPAPRQRKHGVTDGWKGPPTSRALPEHGNAGRRGRTFGARDD